MFWWIRRWMKSAIPFHPPIAGHVDLPVVRPMPRRWWKSKKHLPVYVFPEALLLQNRWRNLQERLRAKCWPAWRFFAVMEPPPMWGNRQNIAGFEVVRRRRWFLVDPALVKMDV